MLIEIIKGCAGLSIWVWKFLITKTSRDLSIAYYPDYENPEWEVSIDFWKKGAQYNASIKSR